MKKVIIIALLFLSCKDKATTVINSEPKIEIELASKEKINSVVNTTLETTIEDNNPNESVNNSDLVRTVLYKGTLDGTTQIQLYINEQGNPCGGNLTTLSAMYKYDNQNNWILLEVTTDEKKEKYCMVEDNFSGVLFLEENENNFNGNWISPDTQKQLKIELKKINVDNVIIEKLNEILFDDLIYNKYDC